MEMNARTQGWDHQVNMDALERTLRGTLRPVVPTPGMVQRLRGRIRFPDPGKMAEGLSDWRMLFVVLGSVLSGALLLITVARALFHFTGRDRGE
jgi:hypothetical protein